MKLVEHKRFALLLACNDSDHIKTTYAGCFPIFVKAFGGEESEIWDLFRVVAGEFPDKDLDKYEGFVVSRSLFDAYGNDPWILRLCFLLQKLDAMQKKVPGLCFGHHVGRQVGKVNGGWDIGVRKVIMGKSLQGCWFLDGLGELPPCLSIIECHRDKVWVVPIGAEVIAISDKMGVEVFCFGDHILGIQGHPEFTPRTSHNLIDRLFNSGSINYVFAEDAKASMEAGERGEPSREFWGKMCKAFLKGR